MTSVQVVIGTQFGDEGKGKLVDMISANSDVVCRCQGGNNAGHTVVVDGAKYFFHLLPSGIIYPKTLAVIGNGVVLSLPGLFKELDENSKKGLHNLEKRLRISDRCHLVLTIHQMIDGMEEERRGGSSIGTTKKGIGPTYSSKVTRNGVRVADLMGDWDRFTAKYMSLVNYVQRRYSELNIDIEKDLQQLYSYRERLATVVCDTVVLMNELIADPKTRILVEGAQSSMLDVDFGTYPYVTSSNCSVGGVCTGLGLAPSRLGPVYGVLKAYTTRVGRGHFPTELNDEIGKHLQEAGQEWGVTTGRRRRVGWLDTVIVRHAHLINNFTAMAMTKLDVLDGLEEVKICRAYINRSTGKEVFHIPANVDEFEQLDVCYLTMAGWKESTHRCSEFLCLPEAAQHYVLTVEKLCGVPIRWVGTGASRDDIITRDV